MAGSVVAGDETRCIYGSGYGRVRDLKELHLLDPIDCLFSDSEREPIDDATLVSSLLMVAKDRWAG